MPQKENDTKRRNHQKRICTHFDSTPWVDVCNGHNTSFVWVQERFCNRCGKLQRRSQGIA